MRTRVRVTETLQTIGDAIDAPAKRRHQYTYIVYVHAMAGGQSGLSIASAQVVPLHMGHVREVGDRVADRIDFAALAEGPGYRNDYRLESQAARDNEQLDIERGDLRLLECTVLPAIES